MSKNAAEHVLSSTAHGKRRDKGEADAVEFTSWKFEGSADEQAAQIVRFVSSRDLSSESRSASMAHESYLRRRGTFRRFFFVVAIVAYLLLAIVLVVTAFLAESHNQSIIAAAGAVVTGLLAVAFTLFTEVEVRQRRRTMRRTQELIDLYASRYARKVGENDRTHGQHEGAVS